MPLHINTSAPAGGRAAPPPAHGLVVKVTTRTRVSRNGTNEYLRADCYRGLNRQRRVRRMRRVVIRSAEAARQGCERGGGRFHAAFLTLTYRSGVLWAPEHVSECVARIRKWCARRGVVARYQWVLELTRAGVPHYHVLLWLPRGLHLPKPDKAGWWTAGATRIERARSPVGYLVKYASKGFDAETAGEIPRGARLFGCSNAQDERHAVRRARLPVWLANITADFQLPARVARVGFVCRATGEVYRSPYRLEVVRGADGRYVLCFTEDSPC
jgi:hypothetical protein